ncbi:hypothetical protein ACWD4J_41160 [Streptomyces sp. NPDC002577]
MPTDALSRLQGSRFRGYLKVRLPHDLDAEVTSVITAYMSSSERARQETITRVGSRVAAVLSAYGQRMASMAVRTNSVEVLRRGVVAVGLAEGRLEDPRDNLFVLAAVNDGASLIGTSLGRLIADVANRLPPSALPGLREFDEREESGKSLQAMGLRGVGSGPTFLYV